MFCDGGFEPRVEDRLGPFLVTVFDRVAAPFADGADLPAGEDLVDAVGSVAAVGEFAPPRP